MAIEFFCPHCGLETFVEEEIAGQSGACRGCGELVTVPIQLLDQEFPPLQEERKQELLHALFGMGAGRAPALAFSEASAGRLQDWRSGPRRVLEAERIKGTAAQISIYYLFPPP